MEAAPHSYLQIGGLKQDGTKEQSLDYKTCLLNDINKKFGMLNGINMKNEKLVLARGFSRVCKRQMAARWRDKDSKHSYRQMKEQSGTQYLDMKELAIAEVFNGIWVDRKRKQQLTEDFGI